MKTWRMTAHARVLAGGGAALAALLFGGNASAQSELVLHDFQGPPDGAIAAGGIPVLDKAGNLYGATLYGGTSNLGTVWKITPSGTETILWSFGSGADGALPIGLSIDQRGNLYGTTLQGGTNNLGTVFEIKSSGKELILWNFGNGTDGAGPGAGVIRDGNGNLLGTTSAGGIYNGGTVFDLTPSGTETVLWNFGNGKDGLEPDGPVLDVNGTLFGTTRLGGANPPPPGYGTVWELTPSGTETVLHSFAGTKDGAQPDGNVVIDKKGNLYGNCHTGGAHSVGTVFKLTPSGKLKVLHAFSGAGGVNPYADVVLKSGYLYSTTNTGGTYNGGTVWKMTLSGALTTLWSLGNGTDGTWTTSGVALDKSGNIYGMTQYGGTGSCTTGSHSGCGIVFKVTP